MTPRDQKRLREGTWPCAKSPPYTHPPRGIQTIAKNNEEIPFSPLFLEFCFLRAPFLTSPTITSGILNYIPSCGLLNKMAKGENMSSSSVRTENSAAELKKPVKSQQLAQNIASLLKDSGIDIETQTQTTLLRAEWIYNHACFLPQLYLLLHNTCFLVGCFLTVKK